MVVIINFTGLFKNALKNRMLFSTKFNILAILLTSLYKPSYSIKIKKLLKLKFRQQRNFSIKRNALIFIQNINIIKIRLRRPNSKRLECLERYIILLFS
jgi:hypothetical protein